MSRNGIFGSSSDFDKRFISDHKELTKLLDHYRGIQPNCKIGFVGGVWDLTHLGHMSYIEKAHEKVDLLVVGVDTDECVKQRKGGDGIDRPVVGFEERARILSYHRSVDYLTPVSKDFVAVLDAVKPDVLIMSKGTKATGRFKNHALYSKHVGKIILLPPQVPQSEVSTTVRIRHLMMQGHRKGLEASKASMISWVEGINESMLSKINETFDKLENET